MKAGYMKQPHLIGVLETPKVQMSRVSPDAMKGFAAVSLKHAIGPTPFYIVVSPAPAGADAGLTPTEDAVSGPGVGFQEYQYRLIGRPPYYSRWCWYGINIVISNQRLTPLYVSRL